MHKLSCFLTATLCATTIHAAQPTQAQPSQVIVPKLKGGVELNVGGMLARPSNSDLNFGSIGAAPAVGAGSLKANSGSGVNAGVGYSVPNSGNDLQLQWSQMHN